jgi:hypothetical protein
MKIKSAIVVVMAELVLFASVATVVGIAQKAQDAGVSTIDPGFVPSTGQINLGYNPKVPSSSLAREIPSDADARAAYLASERLTYAFEHNETNGAASTEAEVTTPIGASPPDYTGEIFQHQRYARSDSNYGLAVGPERPAASAHLSGSNGGQDRARDRHR